MNLVLTHAATITTIGHEREDCRPSGGPGLAGAGRPFCSRAGPRNSERRDRSVRFVSARGFHGSLSSSAPSWWPCGSVDWAIGQSRPPVDGRSRFRGLAETAKPSRHSSEHPTSVGPSTIGMATRIDYESSRMTTNIDVRTALSTKFSGRLVVHLRPHSEIPAVRECDLGLPLQPAVPSNGKKGVRKKCT